MTKIVIGIGCFLLAGIVSAELLMEETFDTAPAQQYQWKENIPNSGKGVSKGWKAWTPKGLAQVDVASGGLHGNTLVLIGSTDTNKETAQITGTLDSPIDFSKDGVFYVSFVFKNQDRSKFSSDYCQLAIRKGSLNLAGIGMDSDGKIMASCMKEIAVGSKRLLWDETYHFVAKIECSAASADKISVRAVTSIGVTVTEPTEWDVVFEASADGLGETVAVTASHGNSRALFDDIKIGVTYDDVLTFQN